ncbi:heme NO-binding domain-containing protein [Thauera sp. CAU 1555]|uniref:Heme NO-binding domain-containing protein n=1 Tax=Thauera sedimentorum TaxID=2767595 RepID=A0ABR9B764_9RHOO|nr:heme NO-binding domain-containing protein [Thauera sedimentorum]MBC9070929.1 heme NO-binding domain-containing protein [Thauera sedimentorum]MBD8501848.1 heme NO-binding domain-containing protein [Thauera sedimentorum]
MKGIVFTEFIEMVEQRFSAEIADRMLDTTDLPSGGAYTSVGTYDHAEMVALVGTLSNLVQMPANALVTAFGEYLFGRFSVLYPRFFTADIGGAFDFLVSIEEVIHAEVHKLYPDAELPRFEVESRNDAELRMIYTSSRHFADLAEGLMRGCVAHYREPLRIAREPMPGTAQTSRERFILTRQA